MTKVNNKRVMKNGPVSPPNHFDVLEYIEYLKNRKEQTYGTDETVHRNKDH